MNKKEQKIALATETRKRILNGELKGKSFLAHLNKLKKDNYLTVNNFLLYLFDVKNIHDTNEEVPKFGAGYMPTGLMHMLQIIDKLELTEGDVFYDLGSGIGLFINFLGIIFPECRFKGVEYSKKRVEESKGISERLNLTNVETYEANVLDFDFSDGTIFYMFNPFVYSILDNVVDRLSKQQPKMILTLYVKELKIPSYKSEQFGYLEILRRN